MKRRHTMLVIALLLLAGAVVNVAVAWDSATRRLPEAGAYAWDICSDSTAEGDLIAWAAAGGLRGDRRIWRTEYAGVSYIPIVFSLGAEWLDQHERSADGFKDHGVHSSPVPAARRGRWRRGEQKKRMAGRFAASGERWCGIAGAIGRGQSGPLR